MVAAEKLVQTKQLDIQQFKLKNVVVCENYKYRDNNHYLNFSDTELSFLYEDNNQKLLTVIYN